MFLYQISPLKFYISLKFDDKFFRHIGQVFNLSICETSGIIGSVGCDGRLLESLNGRVTCRNEENDFACFGYRPTLQIIRHRINNQQDVKSDFELSLCLWK